MGKWRKFKMGGEDHTFQHRHMEFEKNLRHPKEDVKYTVNYTEL